MSRKSTNKSTSKSTTSTSNEASTSTELDKQSARYVRAMSTIKTSTSTSNDVKAPLQILVSGDRIVGLPLDWTRSLTEVDKAALMYYNNKIGQISQFVVACIQGAQTGLMLTGRGGNGKSFSIRETFTKYGIEMIIPKERNNDDDEWIAPDANTWVDHQGRITPKGLVKQLFNAPHSIHLVEDAESIFANNTIWETLRSALESQDSGRFPRRHVTWTVSTGKGSYDFWFTGSIIFVGNQDLPKNNPIIDAVKTRCNPVRFDVTDSEMIAKMKEICLQGFRDSMTADECFEVLEFYLEHRSMDLDFRTLVKGGFKLYDLAKDNANIDWRDMFLARMREKVSGEKIPRKERVLKEGEIARTLADKAKKLKLPLHEKLVLWCKEVGRSCDWALHDRQSPEYVKGFNSAQTHFTRQLKQK